MILVGTDEHGHSVYKQVSSTATVYYIKLGQEGQARNVGTLRDGRIIIPKKRKFHLMRKNNSYGISKVILNDLADGSIVSFRDEHGKYDISKEDYIKQGTSMETGNMNFEEQTFINLDILEKNAQLT